VQQAASAYARAFEADGAERTLFAENPGARPRYLEAFRRSDVTAMLNY